MRLYYETDRFSLYEGDSRSVLPIFPDCYFDSVVCDPPYELGFMGKGWDRSGIAYDVSVWRECLRVLKPGGHLLAFGGSRTYHRLACAIEDAGFEIRDDIDFWYDANPVFAEFYDSLTDEQKALLHASAGASHLSWIYGSGFPKSLDISKQLDAMAGAEREDLGPNIRLGDRREYTKNPTSEFFHPNKAPTMGRVSAPATDAAKQWNGWGTALKPAHEPIVLARKPLDGTVAANVLKHGTGGLNIDGCRIQTGDDLNGGAYCGDERQRDNYSPTDTSAGATLTRLNRGIGEFTQPMGRWPSNLIHDGSDEVLAAFPDAPGQQRPLVGNEPSGAFSRWSEGLLTRNPFEPRLDSGSAARFFYAAKADQLDRNEGLEDLPRKRYTEANMTSRAEREGRGERQDASARNNHPCVKPTSLMRYLCRLITPPGGIVLDPFCGSGSTGKAAMLEGLKFVGIELNAEYCQLAQLRIEAVTKQALLFV